MSTRGDTRARTAGLLAMSTATHILVFSALGLVPSPAEVLAMHEMTFEVIENEPPPEEPKVEPPPPPEPEPEPQRARPKPKAEPEPVAPPPEEQKPVVDEVADFTGETLTAGDGSSWSTVVGSGAPLKGPVGKINAPVTASAKPVAPATGPTVAALDSLARKPAPPAGLDAALQRHYPSRARLQGVEGRVSTRLRILPSGRIGRIQILDESPGGFEFASACRKMLQQASAFVAPLDRSGTPVATDVTFVCTFEVNY